LVFRGRVGSGIGNKAGRMLMKLFAPLAIDTSPFADEIPREDALGTTWVRPVVIVDVDTHRRTPGQRLRQPSYRGVRTDLGPEDLT
jgi:bifunctional non-homologous end joining protein LigD